ncbi:MAG: hypothetical protein L0241_11845 [Planctomycetia bacterium]|nr:hypothetical protein [Planctomycetia bacterium]
MPDVTRFVVSQIDWIHSEYGDRYYRHTPRSERVAEFASFDEAEADRRKREAISRRDVNPFQYGGAALFYQTSLDGPRLHDWLMDVGIEPPENPKGHADWIAWWDAFAHTWSAEQLAHAWQAFDKVRFFKVTEVRPNRKAYVVTEVNWTWHDEPTLEADYEGGNMVRAYRSKTAAEAECDRLNRERQAQPEHNGYSSFTRESRRDGADQMGLDISQTVFFEVVEIELGDDA